MAAAAVLCGVVFWAGTQKLHRRRITHARADSVCWLETMISTTPRGQAAGDPLGKVFPTTFFAPQEVGRETQYLSQEPVCRGVPQEWRSQPLEAARTAMGRAVASSRSTSIRLQNRFGILTDEGRRIGPRRNLSGCASGRPPGLELDSVAPWRGYLRGRALGGVYQNIGPRSHRIPYFPTRALKWQLRDIYAFYGPNEFRPLFPAHGKLVGKPIF